MTEPSVKARRLQARPPAGTAWCSSAEELGSEHSEKDVRQRRPHRFVTKALLRENSLLNRNNKGLRVSQDQCSKRVHVFRFLAMTVARPLFVEERGHGKDGELLRDFILRRVHLKQEISLRPPRLLLLYQVSDSSHCRPVPVRTFVMQL